MIKINDSIKHDPDNGTYGNCHQACLASLLELPLEEVPHFFDKGVFEDTEDGLKAQDIWLAAQGYGWVELPCTGDSLKDALNFAAKYGSKGHYILVAESKKGCGHSVVCKGNKIVHDPSYGATHGIVGPITDEDTGETYFWLCWIVVL